MKIKEIKIKKGEGKKWRNCIKNKFKCLKVPSLSYELKKIAPPVEKRISKVVVGMHDIYPCCY